MNPQWLALPVGRKRWEWKKFESEVKQRRKAKEEENKEELNEEEETKKKNREGRAKETTQKPATETEWKGENGMKNELSKKQWWNV